MDEKAALNWIAEVLEAPPGSISADTPSSHIAGWDSLGMLSLIAALDEQFNIQLSEPDMYSIRGVRDVLAVLARAGAMSVR